MAKKNNEKKVVVDNIDELKEATQETVQEAVQEQAQPVKKSSLGFITEIKEHPKAFALGIGATGAAVAGVGYITYKKGLWSFNKNEEATEE